MGAAMGLMMLWMLHGAMTSQSETSALALILFVGAHVAVVAILLIGGLFAARSTGPMQRLLKRLHRPSLSHISAMLTGMIIAAGCAHLTLHGGLI